MSDQIVLPGGLEEALNQSGPKTGGIEVSVYGGPDAPGGKPVAILHLSSPAEMALLPGPAAAQVGAKLLMAVPTMAPELGKLVIDLALLLIDHVYDVRGDLKPMGGAAKHELIERHRRKLTQRLTIMLNSQREKKKVSNDLLAKQFVDTVLSEVFS